MALFKFRWPGQKEAREQTPMRRSRTAQSESVDDMRRRARHRLIGAAVLVVLGVIGFPILFDTQPRPIPVDVPIEIPDRNHVAPLIVPGETAQTEPQGSAQASQPLANGALGDGEELVLNEPVPLAVPKPPEPPRLVPEPVHAPVVIHKPEPKPEPKPEVQPEPKPAPVPKPVSEAERARALLEGRSVPAAAAPAKVEASKQGRFIVQVGAFADVAKANEVRSKLERAGLKTYTQAVDTKDGKRTRVRVGPFEQRSDADQAAARIKGLGLAASVLTL